MPCNVIFRLRKRHQGDEHEPITKRQSYHIPDHVTHTLGFPAVLYKAALRHSPNSSTIHRSQNGKSNQKQFYIHLNKEVYFYFEIHIKINIRKTYLWSLIDLHLCCVVI